MCMKKVFTIVLIGLFFPSCSDDDNDGIDCALFDPAFPSMFVRIVDSTGANLIENGIIDPNNITIDGDFPNAGFHFNPANEFAVPDAYIREFDNSLSLSIPNESSFRYTIYLVDFENIDLDFEAGHTKIPCNISYYIPTGASFNGEIIELKEISPLEFLIIIEL